MSSFIENGGGYLCIFQFAKRDTIREIEKEVQRRWDKEKIFEVDAPKVATTSPRLHVLTIRVVVIVTTSCDLYVTCDHDVRKRGAEQTVLHYVVLIIKSLDHFHCGWKCTVIYLLVHECAVTMGDFPLMIFVALYLGG